MQQVATILSSTNSESVEKLLNDLDAQVDLLEHDETFCIGPFGVARLQRSGIPAMEAPEDCEIDSITAGWEDFPMEHFVADTVLCDMYPTCPDGAETRFEPSDNFDLCLGLSDDSLDLFSEVVQPQTPSAPTYETPYLNYSPVSVSFTYGADLGDIDAATIRLLLDC